MYDKQIVKQDIESIYLGNIFTVEADIHLPLKGKNGSSIAWKSGDEYRITNEGKINRPHSGSGNREVDITATVSFGDYSECVVFHLTILEKKSDIVISNIIDINEKYYLGESLPSVVIAKTKDENFVTLNVEWENLLLDKPGEYTFEGIVNGFDKKAFANITLINKEDRKMKKPVSFVTGFKLGDVILTDSIFKENKIRDVEYLLNLDDDKMLYSFRAAAGLSTNNSSPLIGWDAPECLLRGHTTGHYLSAIALGYANKDEYMEKFSEKINYMISELSKCQKEFSIKENYNYGFLSAYSEEQFDLLEEYVVYPKIWAPYYTLHKIMAGLLDCYTYANNQLAFEMVRDLGLWVYNRLKKLPKEKLNKMWSMYIAGEFGGINETFALLYGLTNDERYLKTAKLFDNDKLFFPMEKNIDTLGGIHANQHIPQIIGALEIYNETGEEKYYKIASNFWEIVTSSHIFNIGGTGDGEMFKEHKVVSKYIGEKNAETCATYNMLKLTKHLYLHNPEAKYMDYYENALYNHILASQEQSGPFGGSTYFMPLSPGGQKGFDRNENSCCHGTGMENHIKYQESIYFSTENTLYVNLYIPSILNWREKGISIEQNGDYLNNHFVTFKINGNSFIDFKFRIPTWLKKPLKLSLNGNEINVNNSKGYACLNGNFKDGDEIKIELPFELWIEPTYDNKEIASIKYGPLVMVAKSDSKEFISIKESQLNEFIKIVNPLIFCFNDMDIIPNYMANDFCYHAYFKIIM